MAFTSAEATKVRHYLGYPQVYQYANPRLESAITVVGGDSDAVTLVQGLLASIDGVWTQIQTVALVSAGVKALDKGDVELYDNNMQTKGMRDIGRMFVARLSDLFGVPVANDIFGLQGYSGDAWRMNNARPTLMGLG